MRIESFQFFKLFVPYRRTSRSSWTNRDGSPIGLVKIVDSDGVAGYGDFLARPSFAYGDAILQSVFPHLKGTDVYDAIYAENIMAASGAWALKGEASYSAMAVLTAIEVALWDIRARRSGVPLYKILGGSTNERLMFCQQVASGPPDETEKTVSEALERGVPALSVKLAKLNRSPAEDIDTVRRIRELAPKLPLSLDINMAWSMGTAVRTLNQLEKYDILFCESPTRGLKNLRDIRSRTSIPIAADEGAWSPENILRIVETGAADIVLVDVPSLGGLRNAIKVLGILETANIPTIVHGNGEIVTCRAAYHLAMAFPSFGIYPHQYYYELEEGSLTPGGGGKHPVRMEPPQDMGIMPIDEVTLPISRDQQDQWINRKSRPPFFPKY